MTIPTISTLPTAPSRSDPANFSANGDSFFAAVEKKLQPELNTAIGAMNTTAAETDQNAIAAMIAAQNSDAAAQTVQQVSGATPWVSGTTYSKNQCAISQINFQTYRRKVAGAGTTDPMNDPTNWAMLVGSGSFIPVPQTSATFDLSKGNFFTRTMSANETWSFTNIPQDGYSWTVEVTHTGGTLTLPTSVKTPSNQVYTFTAGKTHLLMFVTRDKGARIRLVAAPNYDN